MTDNDVFITEVEVDYWGAGPLKDAKLSPVRVSWRLSREERSWGVKSLLPSVPDQDVIFHFESYGDDAQVTTGEVSFRLSDVRVEFEFGDDVSSLGLYPVRLEIGRTGQVELHFRVG